MAPKSSPFPSSSSQKTKQQTISSFFTPKAASTVPPAAKPAAKTTARPIAKPTEPKPAPSALPSASASEDEENDLPIKRNRTTRRKRIEDDEGLDQQSSPKRAKVRIDDIVATSPLPDLNASREPLADRTSKYIFSSPPQENDGRADAASQKLKEELHRKFVKKLGKADSLAELRRRHKSNEGEESEDPDAEEEEAPKPAKGKKSTSKRAAGKLTPGEKQYLEIKRKHLDTILLVEVGYKFQIYGEDAKIASKDLGIFCIPGKVRYDERKLLCRSEMAAADYDRSLGSPSDAVCFVELPGSPTTGPRETSYSS